MEKELEKLADIIEVKIPTIVEALEKAEPTSEEYNKLLTNFNSSMVVYSEIQTMFAQKAYRAQQTIKEEKNDGTNN